MSIIKKIFFLAILSLFSCQNNDDNNDPQSFDYTCCDENPFEATNVDNLDQSLGEIIANSYTTPNQDGYHENLGFMNLDYYPNNNITIYNSNEEVIFQTSNYQTDDAPLFPLENNIPRDGVYKYKLVVENEETFLEFGYFCVITDAETSTALCEMTDFDPIILGI